MDHVCTVCFDALNGCKSSTFLKHKKNKGTNFPRTIQPLFCEKLMKTEHFAQFWPRRGLPLVAWTKKTFGPRQRSSVGWILRYCPIDRWKSAQKMFDCFMLDPNRGRSRTNGRPLVRPLSKAIGVVSVMFITLLFWLFAAPLFCFQWQRYKITPLFYPMVTFQPANRPTFASILIAKFCTT